MAVVACAVLWAEPPPAGARTAEPTEAEVSPDRGEKTTWLLGHARTGRRRWVTGAVVVATPESGESKIFVTATNVKGAYRFEAMPEGTYQVMLLKHGLEPVVKPKVDLRFPFRAVVEVEMEPASGAPPAEVLAATTSSLGTTAGLGGRILDRVGDPIGEVRVRLTRVDGSVDPRDAVSDEDGEFAVTNVLPGKWKLEVLGAGYLPIRVPVSLSGEGELRAVLIPQPASYEPQPLDLMPPELPIPPPPLEPEPAPSGDAVADADTASETAEPSAAESAE